MKRFSIFEPQYIKLQVSDISGKGKGLIVTENVSKGTLILVEKAFTITFDDDYKGNMKSINSTRKETMHSFKTHGLNMIETIQALWRNPYKAEMLYSLYAGPDFPRANEQMPPNGMIQVSSLLKKHILNL